MEKTPLAAILSLKMRAKIVPGMFVMENISCKFNKSAYNTFCSRGANGTISAHCSITDKKTPMVAILFFKMMPEIFLVKILL